MFNCGDILLTRVTGSEELFGVMSAIATPAQRFGSSEFEIERGCLVGGRGRYGAVAATCGSPCHRVLDIPWMIRGLGCELSVGGASGTGDTRDCLLE